MRAYLSALLPFALLACLATSGLGCRAVERELEGEADPVPVRTHRLTSGALPTEAAVSAEIRASRRAAITAQQGGRIDSVGPREGDSVSQGQAVIWLSQAGLEIQLREQEAQVDAARSVVRQHEMNIAITEQENTNQQAQAEEGVHQAEIAVAQSKTELDSAKNDLDRKKGLLEEKAIAESQVEAARLQWEVSQDKLKTAQSRLEAARAQLRLAQGSSRKVELQREQLAAARADLRRAEAAFQTAQLGLEETVIRAPISGLVTERKAEPGQTVSPGQGPLLTLVDNSSLEVQAFIDGQYAPHLTPGLEATLTSLQFPDRHWPVVLKETLPASDPQTNTITARFSFLEEPPRMVDGTNVQLRLRLGERRGILVPLQAVLPSGRGRAVLKVQDGVTAVKAVEALASDEVYLLVAEGELRPGDEVIVEGLRELQNGRAVIVEPPAARGAQNGPESD